MEKEYYSNCCDAPPRDYKMVDTRDDSTGHCQNCGDGAVFYIMGGRMLNDPEFSKIIDEETEKVESETEFKKQYNKGLKLYLSSGKIIYEDEGVEKLRQRYNKLVDILNKRSNNG